MKKTFLEIYWAIYEHRKFLLSIVLIVLSVVIVLPKIFGPPFPIKPLVIPDVFALQMEELAKKCKGEFVIQMISSDKDGDKMILTCSEDRRWRQ